MMLMFKMCSIYTVNIVTQHLNYLPVWIPGVAVNGKRANKRDTNEPSNCKL